MSLFFFIINFLIKENSDRLRHWNECTKWETWFLDRAEESGSPDQRDVKNLSSSVLLQAN
jgi:hypothetical protein